MQYYVSTTYGTTWMGSVESMQEGYNYCNLFFGTYDECLQELEDRRS